MKAWLPGFLALVLSAPAMADDLMISSSSITHGGVVTEKGASWHHTSDSIGFSLPQRLSAFGLQLPNVNWSAYTHVEATVTNPGSFPAVVTLVLDSGTTGWMGSDFIIAPGATRTVEIPLGRPSGALPLNWPSLADGVYQTPCWGTIDKSKVKMIRIWNHALQGPINLEVSHLKAVTLTPRTSGLVDVYGQQTFAYPGKIASDGEFLAMAAADPGQYSGVPPYNSDSFGALAGSDFTNGTGRWRTAKQNGKWYILAPNGDRFFSTGVNCAGAGAAAEIAGHESLFTSLPDPNQFPDHYTNYINPGTGQPDPGFNFYTANAQREWGANWHPLLADSISRRMRTWGFNTVSTVSLPELYESNSGLATMPGITISGNYRTVPCPEGAFAMPDVFDPAWKTAAYAAVAAVVPSLNANPMNVGLFVDNELPWANHWETTDYRYQLALNVFKAPANQPAKDRLITNLSNKYRTIGHFNAVWGVNAQSFTALRNSTTFAPSQINAAVAADLQYFLAQYAKVYFSTIRAAMTQSGYHGLYLGCRFFYFAPEVLDAAKRYCDVVSFNAYDRVPSAWRTELKNLDAPVLIGEFGFAATDLGRVGGFYPCAVTEEDRIAAYQTYVADAMTWTNLVGLHWYKWDDDPATGRQWDNQNHSLGLVSITDVPYAGFVAAAKQANTNFISRMINP